MTTRLAKQLLHLVLHLLAVPLSVVVSFKAAVAGAKLRGDSGLSPTSGEQLSRGVFTIIAIIVVAPALMLSLPWLMRNLGGVASPTLSLIYSLGISAVPALMMGYHLGE